MRKIVILPTVLNYRTAARLVHPEPAALTVPVPEREKTIDSRSDPDRLRPRRRGHLMRKDHSPFPVIGIAFIAIGLAGNRVFVTLGIVFLAIGLSRRVRNGRWRKNAD
jgi:hypothetical protein